MKTKKNPKPTFKEFCQLYGEAILTGMKSKQLYDHFGEKFMGKNYKKRFKLTA